MRAVVDTNVWVSGLILPGSVPGQVLDAVRGDRLEAVASWALAEEIVEVLRRPRIRRYGITEQDVLDTLVVLGPLLPEVEVDVDVRDPDDAPVVACAVTARAGAIVTGDDDLRGDPGLVGWLAARGVEVLAPGEVLERLDR